MKDTFSMKETLLYKALKKVVSLPVSNKISNFRISA